MPATAPYHKVLLTKIHALKYDFTETGKSRVIKLLKELSAIRLEKSADLENYYRQLLFLLAYPANQDIYSLARKEITALTVYLKQNPAIARRLDNSGLPQTFLTGCFSFYLNKFLFENNTVNLSLHSVDGDKDILMQFLNTSLSGIEREMLSEEKPAWGKWLKMFAGNTRAQQLSFILKQLEISVNGISAREAAFSCFKVFTRIHIEDAIDVFSASVGRHTKIFYHKSGLLKSSREPIFKIGPKQARFIALGDAEKAMLVKTAQSAIYPFFKETDPFTYVQTEETEYFECERGVTIALFYMQPEKKLELECYCGYLLLKNNVPLAYGGVWMVGRQCRFGLNILPSFRGGESQLLTSQLLHLFVQHFKIHSFVIEPFQLGKGNKEGIQSASFWFYYKMGFRPMQPLLLKLAKEEFRKISTSGEYRSSVAVLTKLSGSVMVVHDGKKGQYPFYDINALSQAVSTYLKNTFNNDRDLALKKLAGKHAAAKGQLPLSVMAIIGLNKRGIRLDQHEYDALVQLFRVKAYRERDFVNGLARQEKFLRLLEIV